MNIKGISETITTVILITIILAVSISALSYVTSAIQSTQTTAEITQVKDLFRTLADKINQLYGTPNATYRITTTINKGSIGLTDYTNIVIKINSSNGIPYSYSYPTYNFSYWISKSDFFEQPQQIYGTPCSQYLYNQGGLQIINSTICSTPIVQVVTALSTTSWQIKLYTIITISNTIINNISVYKIEIVTFKLGTVTKNMGPLTISLTITQSMQTFNNIAQIVISKGSQYWSESINNYNNLLIISNSIVTFNFS